MDENKILQQVRRKNGRDGLNMFKQGEHIYFAFLNGKAAIDSQHRPRMYKSRKNFESAAPQYLIESGELAEYAPLMRADWLNFTADFSMAECSLCGNLYEVSPEEKPSSEYFEAFKQFYRFCPNCGAKMDLNKEKKK